MPLTAKGEKILANMQAEYGKDRGTRVFYASEKKGTITGVHRIVKKLTRRRTRPKKRGKKRG